MQEISNLSNSVLALELCCSCENPFKACCDNLISTVAILLIRDMGEFHYKKPTYGNMKSLAIGEMEHLYSLMALKWCTKLDIVWKSCCIDFQGSVSQISRWHRTKNHQFWSKKIDHLWTVTPVWIHQWLRNNAQCLMWYKRVALLFFLGNPSNFGHSYQIPQICLVFVLIIMI